MHRVVAHKALPPGQVFMQGFEIPSFLHDSAPLSREADWAVAQNCGVFEIGRTRRGGSRCNSFFRLYQQEHTLRIFGAL